MFKVIPQSIAPLCLRRALVRADNSRDKVTAFLVRWPFSLEIAPLPGSRPKGQDRDGDTLGQQVGPSMQVHDRRISHQVAERWSARLFGRNKTTYHAFLQFGCRVSHIEAHTCLGTLDDTSDYRAGVQYKRAL